MAYYTIKQLADTFDVSRQAIQKQLKKQIQPFISKRKFEGRLLLVVNEEGLSLLKKHFKYNENNILKNKNTILENKNNKNNKTKTTDETVNIKQLLAAKDKTISSLKDELKVVHEELARTHAELDHEHELHLMDQKQVKQLTE